LTAGPAVMESGGRMKRSWIGATLAVLAIGALPASATADPTLTLTLGAPPAFAPFIPGVGTDYIATSTGLVNSSAAEAILTVADPSTVASGHLLNGDAAMPREDAPEHPAGPHPLAMPTAEQGVALAALESGRWRIESGAFTVHDGPGPGDPLGLLRELRVSDWVTADGELTLTGRKALARWLEHA